MVAKYETEISLPGDRARESQHMRGGVFGPEWVLVEEVQEGEETTGRAMSFNEPPKVKL